MEDMDDPLLLDMDDPLRPEEDVDGPQVPSARVPKENRKYMQRERGARVEREREIENVKKVLN